MSERDGYPARVPCWVDTLQSEPEAAVGFYTQLFGWEAESWLPSESPRKYFVVCKLRGHDVAAVGSPQSGDVPPDWNTYIRVDSVADVAARAIEAGGSVILEPFESLDGGCVAALADPAGAVFRIWQPGAHRGARLVNEPGAWAMSVLNTRDVEGSRRFYGAVLGWCTEALDAGGSEATMWRLPGYVGGEPEQPVPRDVVAVMAPIAGEGSQGDVAPHWSVNFWVHDADALAAKAAELGGNVVVPPSDRPGFRDAVVADPQGAVLSVSQLIAGA
jgi:uncharacterized protein